jgi:uncharacterized protein
MPLACIVLLFATGCGEKATSAEDYYSSPIKLPDGTVILAEHMRTPKEMMRGMMFREELKPDRGMLFSHGGPGRYPYWMFQVRMSLDIVWLDAQGHVVEVSERTPPCPDGPATKCPHFGGNADALYVAEFAAGTVQKHHLAIGDRLEF